MDMHVDTTSSDNLTFAGDHLGSRSDYYCAFWLHIGIASFAQGGNTSVPNCNIGFHNSPVIENQRVGDDRINRALSAGTLRLTHAVADDFPASELHLLAIDREVLLHLDDEVGIREAHFVPGRWANHLCIGATPHAVGHPRFSP